MTTLSERILGLKEVDRLLIETGSIVKDSWAHRKIIEAITHIEAAAIIGDGPVIEPIHQTYRNKFGEDKKDVEVYITPDKGIFLKIDHQTFELKSNRIAGEKYEHYDPEDLQAGNLCAAINRLMKNCALSVYDNRTMTERLSNPATPQRKQSA